MPESENERVAVSAATWMQVVFGGLSVCVAVVALVIAYFAWVQPHSADGGGDQPGAAPPATAATSGRTTSPAATSTPDSPAAGVPLTTYPPKGGGTALSDVDGGIAVACPSNQSGDKQRAVQYDLPEAYAGFGADLRADGDNQPHHQFQVKVLAGGRTVGNVVFKAGETARADADLSGARDLRLEVSCDNARARLILLNPMLTPT